jgi:hypothetical protein
MELNKKTNKLHTRDRYFQILIFIGFIAPTSIVIQDLTSLMSATQFISQTTLESILENLRIPDRGRVIGLEKFHGQLEKDQITGLPYWNIYLITQNLTTRKRLLDTLLNDLFPTNANTTKTGNSTVQVRPVLSFYPLQEKNRLLLPNTVWYPGFFFDQTVLFDSLFTNDEVEEVIKTYPEKYLKMVYDVTL